MADRYQGVYPPALIELIDQVKQRRSVRAPLTGEVDDTLSTFEDGLSEGDRLFYWLSLVLHHPEDPEAPLLERLATPVWELQDPEVQVVWRTITCRKYRAYLLEKSRTPGFTLAHHAVIRQALSDG